MAKKKKHLLVKLRDALFGYNWEHGAVDEQNSTECIITCPECGHQEKEHIPMSRSVVHYICLNCKTVMHPKDGDCCVFASYGDKPCFCNTKVKVSKRT